jgi:hypothetical protein
MKGKETKATRLELVCLDKNRETLKEALFEGFALPRSWENPFEGADEIKVLRWCPRRIRTSKVKTEQSNVKLTTCTKY